MTYTLTGAPLHYPEYHSVVLFPFGDEEGQRWLSSKETKDRHKIREGFVNIHENSDGSYTAIHTSERALKSRKKADKEVKQFAEFYAKNGHQYRCRYRIRVKLK